MSQHQQNSACLSIRPVVFHILFFCCFILFPQPSLSQTTPNFESETEEIAPPIAPVKIDSKVLFFVRGTSSYPATKRAQMISERIANAASNISIPADSVRIVTTPDYLRIYAGPDFIMNIYDVDAEWETLDKKILADIISGKVKEAITSYRNERSRDVLLKKSLRALGALIILAVILFVFIKLIKRLNALFEKFIKSRLDTIENKSFKLISSGQLWKSIHVLTKTVKILSTIVIVAVFLNYILSLFPWTNSVTAYTLQLFTEPIMSIGRSILHFLPSLAFLVIIFFVTRYFLRLIKLFFGGIGKGAIVIKDFDQDWAMPTFRIVRLFIVAFSIVVAYPYIPGSESSAFKGVSVFIGILISLGSSSFIGNVIAGYSMTYRRAFRIGDRIKVDDITGFVIDQKLLVTRLRSVKNEEIVIPNSVLLSSNIINYNTRSKDPGLILHTTVNIGYATPWRMVESMLILAADRTEGLLKTPSPYVLQKGLGEFAVTYEINAYCNDVANMYFCYTRLHQNILDIFNENNVQIMVPSYEGDPEIPKVVPKEHWVTPLVDQQPPAHGNSPEKK